MPDETATLRIDGSVAVVTGAAQGLGLAMVEQLARNGAAAVIADLQLDKAESEAERLRASGLDVSAAQLDVTDSDAVNRLFDGIVEERGKLDILVNSAGVGQTIAPVSETPDEEWRRVIAVTLDGTFYCARAAAAIMERRESGSIVNISSINGLTPNPLVGAYNVAKAGVIALTKTMAIELAAYSVRVNAIAPGPVYTEFNQRNMAQRAVSLGISEEEMLERVRKAVPLGRWGEPFDMACCVLFLCSPAASFITGEVYRVSGGMEGVPSAPPKRPKS